MGYAKAIDTSKLQKLRQGKALFYLVPDYREIRRRNDAQFTPLR